MPQVPITMPQLGESMAEATIVAIKVQPGDKVVADQEIIEVETDKAVMGVTTPCKGKDRDDRARRLRERIRSARCSVMSKRARRTRRVSSKPHRLRKKTSLRKFRRVRKRRRRVRRIPAALRKSMETASRRCRRFAWPRLAKGYLCRSRQRALAIFRRESVRAWPSCS